MQSEEFDRVARNSVNPTTRAAAYDTSSKGELGLTAKLKVDLAIQKRLKVVHYVTTWLPQTTTWLYNQVMSLPAEVENLVVCNRTSNLDQFPTTNMRSLESFARWRQYVERLKRKLKLAPPFGLHLPLLEEVIRKERPDILHTHFGHMGWVNSWIAKKYGLKHVVSFYGADVNAVPHRDPAWLPRYKEMGSAVDQVLCEGPFMAGSIARLGIPPQKIKIQRLGVDLAGIRFEPRQYIKGEGLRFLITASFREKKGIPVALEALKRFRRVNEQFEVTIIGDASLEQEKIEKEKIIQTIEQTCLGSKIRMLGFQPHKTVLQESYRHHIFLSPSLTALDGDCEGGAPVSIIEMAASGMPVVSTKHCDIPYVLSEANAPYLAEERDAEGLCNTIVRLLSCNWKDLVHANRSYIEQEFDLKRQGERLHQIYLA